VCGLLATAHSLLYVFAVPPWALEDEEQHVDYVLELRDHHRVPRVDETLRPSIVASEIKTKRLESLGYGTTPTEPDPAKRGLIGLSYEGYQPPLYYVALVPFVSVIGDRPLTAMYLLRVVGAVLAGVGAALTALLAAQWARCSRRTRERAALIAGLVIAAVPAYAEAGARVNNDTGLTLAVVASLLAAARFAREPTPRRAWCVGLLAAAAAASKITGVVAVAPALVALGAVWNRASTRDRLRWLVAIVVPAAAVTLAWALVSRARYGVFNPATAVVEVIGPFRVVPLHELVTETARLTGLPFGHWRTGPAVAIGLAVVFVVGLALSRRCRPTAFRLASAAALAAAIVIGLVPANRAGILNAVNTRYVLCAYPALVAVAAAGWATVRSRWSSFAPAVAMWSLAALFFVAGVLPRFPFRVG
jgi:4-amino-4-deoxy-L-arabinose transferase-like glycosyltransferase